MWAINLYFWIAAIGFPIIGSHWLVYERKMSKRDYMTGHDDGWEDGWNEAIDAAAAKLYRREKDLIECGPQTYLQQCECNVMARAIKSELGTDAERATGKEE
jgi:hypothetical protein